MSAAVIAACIAATVSFGAYTRTLLPGVDLGDTGGFQAAVAAEALTARQAYPLYFGLARPFVTATAPANPARGLNLFSAVTAALAVGVLAAIATLVTRSPAGGAAAAALFAFSYTWWNQAIIAEVYALHLLLVGLCLLALAWYARAPGDGRLAVFFSLYALSFGNHLTMVLLLAPFALFLLLATPRRADIFRPAALGLACGLAVAGTLQYLPQLLATRHAIEPPMPWSDAMATFWFDVTKADWRETMVLAVDRIQVADRLGFLWFDARQQFGIAGLVLAAAGACRLWHLSRPWAALAWSAFAINFIFAGTYNVGDPHVFFLPGHYFTAIFIAAAVAPWGSGRWTQRSAIAGAIALAAFAGWRGYDTWSAADRSQDRRAERLVDRVTFGLDEKDTLLVSGLNWHVENALSYETRVSRRRVAWVRLADVMPYFPFLATQNGAAGRDLILTRAAAQRIVAAGYDQLFPIVPDAGLPRLTPLQAAEAIPEGAPYVLTLLTPPRGERIEPGELQGILEHLTGRASFKAPEATYAVVAGLAGLPPALAHGSPRPFRDRVDLDGLRLDIRMESWLPNETFRRGGFGHVVADGGHSMALERGLNLVWFRDGVPSPPTYGASLYADEPRFRIPAGGFSRLALAIR